eukprot:scaffold123044_cov19-Prasinocladus_malaysianus.AAC.1
MYCVSNNATQSLPDANQTDQHQCLTFNFSNHQQQQEQQQRHHKPTASILVIASAIHELHEY